MQNKCQGQFCVVAIARSGAPPSSKHYLFKFKTSEHDHMFKWTASKRCRASWYVALPRSLGAALGHV